MYILKYYNYVNCIKNFKLYNNIGITNFKNHIFNLTKIYNITIYYSV